MIKMVVFDMAGTTVNEDNVVYKTVRNAINAEGYDFSLAEVLAAGAGKEKLQAIKSVLALRGIEDENLAVKIFTRFKIQLDEAYDTLPITEQPNASLLFSRLREQQQYVVLNTGYSRPVAEALVAKIGWQVGRDIDALVTASDVDRNRPFPDMIHYAMQQLGVAEASTVCKVGDSAIDIEEGRNAGCMINVGITTGAQTVAQLLTAQPTAVINDLMELLPVIEGHS
jgi:phosphonatase-like hydrolase